MRSPLLPSHTYLSQYTSHPLWHYCGKMIPGGKACVRQWLRHLYTLQVWRSRDGLHAYPWLLSTINPSKYQWVSTFVGACKSYLWSSIWSTKKRPKFRDPRSEGDRFLGLLRRWFYNSVRTRILVQKINLKYQWFKPLNTVLKT